MDFFASQDLARRKTKWLVLYFVLAVILIVVSIYFVVVLALKIGLSSASDQSRSVKIEWFNPFLFAAVSTVVLLIISIGSVFKSFALRGGGEAVALGLGGRHLPQNSNTLQERRVLNVVEEMALAAGVPVPPVYMLDGEPGINAFAAGFTVDDAVIGVNRGTVQQLNREELQGVIAHEFSHILNGDMRMNIRLIGILHGIQIIALIGMYVLHGMSRTGRGSSRNSDSGKGIIVVLAIAVGLLVIGSVGLFFGRLIKASVSRQREYLADASAVQFTRSPDGISGALKMIGATSAGSKIESPKAEEISHMFFASSKLHQLFSTHPPLVPRIQRIDQKFTGDFQAYAVTRRIRKKKVDGKKESKLKFPGFDKFAPGMGGNFPIHPAILVAAIGDPREMDVAYANKVVAQIPEKLLAAGRDVFSARCLVFASLLDADKEIRGGQLNDIFAESGQASVDETIKLKPMFDELNLQFRLPLFEIVQGTLTAMSPKQFVGFRETVKKLIEADRKITLFEFFLQNHLLVHLQRCFGKKLPPASKYKQAQPLKIEFAKLISLLVCVGHVEPEQRRIVFREAMKIVFGENPQDVELLDDIWDYATLSDAIAKLSLAAPQVKKQLLQAAAVAITFDKNLTVEEVELFRAIAESLDCPVPVLVANRASAVTENTFQNTEDAV